MVLICFLFVEAYFVHASGLYIKKSAY